MVRQVLTESMALACLGGAVGLLLAKWGIDFLVRLIPSGLPASEIGLDGHVLAFTAAVSLLSGVLFGLVPSIQGSRASLAEALKRAGVVRRKEYTAAAFAAPWRWVKWRWRWFCSWARAF